MSELKLRPTKQEQKRKPETQNKSYTLQKARGRSHATSRAAARVCRRRSRFLSPPAWGSPTAQPSASHFPDPSTCPSSRRNSADRTGVRRQVPDCFACWRRRRPAACRTRRSEIRKRERIPRNQSSVNLSLF